MDDRDLSYAIRFIEKNGIAISEEDLLDLMSTEEKRISPQKTNGHLI